MTNLARIDNRINGMTESAIDKVVAFENTMKQLPQVAICTEHLIHAGMYARTIVIPAGTAVTGVLIKIPTIVVISGQCTFYNGDGTTNVNGCQVFAASGKRKQACYAITDTTWTMLFKTDEKSVEGCESVFTEEPERLASRGLEAQNVITITGE